MKSRQRTPSAPGYTPEHDRRADDRFPDAAKGLWFRSLKPSELLAGIAVAGALLSALGWRQFSISELDTRVSKIEKRQDLESYVLCVIVRRTDPDATPPDCEPIIKSRGRP